MAHLIYNKILTITKLKQKTIIFSKITAFYKLEKKFQLPQPEKWLKTYKENLKKNNFTHLKCEYHGTI